MPSTINGAVTGENDAFVASRTTGADVAVPRIVIRGDRDMSAPIDLTGRKTAAAIPGARLEVYAGGPHGIFFTHADRLTAHIKAFALG
jgi:non-heme chloroperoxidase